GAGRPPCRAVANPKCGRAAPGDVRVKSLVVLNTRPREQAAELSGLLEQAGFSAIEAPAIAIMPAWDPVELEAVRRNLQAGAYALVVLASQNGAHGLEAELREVRVMC